MSTTQPPCLINQDTCGRKAGNPVCPKCGIDDRVVYPGQGDLEMALANARTRYFESQMRWQEQELLAARKALESAVNSEVQRQAELTAVRDRAMGVNYRRFKFEVLGFDLLLTLIGVPIFFVLMLKFNWSTVWENGKGDIFVHLWVLILCLSPSMQFVDDFQKFRNKWLNPLLCYQDLKAKSTTEQQKNKLLKYSATYRYLSACEGIADGTPTVHGTGS